MFFNISGIPNILGADGKFLMVVGERLVWSTVSTLPDQTSQSGKFLTTNGTTASWATVTEPSLGNWTFSGDVLNDATGVVTTGNGSAPAPGFAFSANPATGIRSAGARSIIMQEDNGGYSLEISLANGLLASGTLTMTGSIKTPDSTPDAFIGYGFTSASANTGMFHYAARGGSSISWAIFGGEAMSLGGNTLLLPPNLGAIGATTLTVGNGNTTELILGDTSIPTMVKGNVGFYGTTPVAKAAHPVTLGDVITILTNLGLCS